MAGGTSQSRIPQAETGKAKQHRVYIKLIVVI